MNYITMEFEFYNCESILSKLTEIGYSVFMLYEEQTSWFKNCSFTDLASTAISETGSVW
jgi:hypothetical protein